MRFTYLFDPRVTPEFLNRWFALNVEVASRQAPTSFVGWTLAEGE